MKRNYYTLALLLTLSFLTTAQTQVNLNMKQMLNGSVFKTGMEGTNSIDQTFTVNRLEYYVSEIVLTHDGGKETPVPDTWLLVDPNEDSTFSLGNFAITKLEKIRFSIGVDPEHNHADPAQYERGHPLAPKLPSMHWGWTAGYRFVALEGKTGRNNSITYEVHALGDDFYYPVELITAIDAAASEINIEIHAEYSQLLRGISVSGGLIVHGSTGAAITLLKNFRDHVFSTPEGGTNTLNVPEFEFTSTVNIYPNPSAGPIKLTYSGQKAVHVTITDLLGKQVQAFDLKTGTVSIELPTGIYLVKIGDLARRVVISE